MDIRQRVGRRIKQLREEKGWSQEELAHRAELHRTYVSGVERGVRNPTLTVLSSFASALQVSMDLLVSKER